MPDPTTTVSGAPPQGDDTVHLLLLRHAHVDSHRGDVPITPAGREQARSAGQWLGRRGDTVAAVLFGGTRRTQETAQGLLDGLRDSHPAGLPGRVEDSFALRNPDLYLGGSRVTMVSSAEAFADQVPRMRARDVLEVPFYQQWLTHPERVGFWLRHTSPPGDDAAAVYARVCWFARSLSDNPHWHGKTVVAVTHSPVLRSVGLHLRATDPGEPAYVHGYELTVAGDGTIHITEVGPSTDSTPQPELSERTS